MSELPEVSEPIPAIPPESGQVQVGAVQHSPVVMPQLPTDLPAIGYVQRLLQIVHHVLRPPYAQWRFWMPAAVVVIVAAVAVISQSLPRQIHFSFAHAQSCVAAPMLFPSVWHSVPNDPLAITRPAAIAVGHIPIFADALCVHPQEALLANTQYASLQEVAIFGVRFIKKVRVITGPYAAAAASTNTQQPIPLGQPLKFHLTAPDTVFTYRLAGNNKESACTQNNAALTCPLLPLQLAYSSTYSLRLIRLYGGKEAGTVLTNTVETLSAVQVTSSSIAANVLVYDNPKQITLTANKPVRSLEGAQLTATVGGQVTPIPIQTTFSGTTITISWSADLPRRAGILLHIGQITAEDTSQLESAYAISFSTSGGPKVIGINLSPFGNSAQPTIVISFDQQLLAGQNIGALVSLTANGTTQPVAISQHGSSITVSLDNALPLCARMHIATASSIQSQYGFLGDSGWSYDARVACYSTFSIGTSVQGRAITAYQFGNGPSLIVYVAAMHGNESNTATLMRRWINELDSNPDAIPSNRTIVVIPEANPDGVAAYIRENAHQIDLNRNFPANNWQTQVIEPWSGGALTNEGGPYPLSEPESQALASYIQAVRPRLVLTYHSNASLVEANDAGDSDQLGALYGTDSGYRAIPTYAIGNTFDYSTTGAFEDWMRDKLGLPALLVELSTSYSDEFNTNRSAMWAMATLP